MKIRPFSLGCGIGATQNKNELKFKERLMVRENNENNENEGKVCVLEQGRHSFGGSGQRKKGLVRGLEVRVRLGLVLVLVLGLGFSQRVRG
jgi:hypothetical protein